jgi:hypothetical protein
MKPSALLLAGALVAFLGLSACSTAPLSYIYAHQVTDRADIFRYPVTVMEVDGVSTLQNPIPIAPGPHKFVIAAPPITRTADPVLRAYTLDIAPCTRYYIAANRQGKLAREWDLVIEATESVGGCDPQEELRKAAAVVAAAGPAPAALSVLATR